MRVEIIRFRVQAAIGAGEDELLIEESVELGNIARDLSSPKSGLARE